MSCEAGCANFAKHNFPAASYDDLRRAWAQISIPQRLYDPAIILIGHNQIYGRGELTLEDLCNLEILMTSAGQMDEDEDEAAEMSSESDESEGITMDEAVGAPELRSLDDIVNPLEALVQRGVDEIWAMAKLDERRLKAPASVFIVTAEGRCRHPSSYGP